MIGGYQIISLNNVNNTLGTSVEIKGLYKKVKKAKKQIKIEDLIIDGITLENVFITVHIEEDKYVGQFGAYKITFSSDNTYVIEENSGSGDSGLYWVGTDSYSLGNNNKTYNFSDYPVFAQLFTDLPSVCVVTKMRLMSGNPAMSTIELATNYSINILFGKINENTYQALSLAGCMGWTGNSFTFCLPIIEKISDTQFKMYYSKLSS